MSLKFIHVVACVGISFLFKAEWYSIVCIHHILFIQSSISGQVGYFHVSVIVNNTAMNMVYPYILSYFRFVSFLSMAFPKRLDLFYFDLCQ